MKSKIAAINRLLIKEFGVPPGNTVAPDPVDTLIATILSQNTNDKNSFRAYRNLKNKFASWEIVAALSPSSLEPEIRIAGLAKQKAKAILNVLRSLQAENGLSLAYLREMKVEEALRELTAFNGVGVKTASCVLLFSFGKNLCPVDTHVHRVANRLGLVTTSAPDKTFSLINKHLPDGIGHAFHTNMIRLGREICKPQSPACACCPLKKHCLYDNKNDEVAATKGSGSFMLLDSLA